MRIGLKSGLLLLGFFGLAFAALAQDEGGGRGGAGAAGAASARGGEGNRVFLGLGPKPDLAAALRGQPLFGANCGGCHGADARGGANAANLLYSDLVVTDVAGSNVAPIIRSGKGSMPAFPTLTAAQVTDIAQYLDQLVEDAANRGTYSYQNVLVGNADAGKVYFDGNCASCHSPTGNLKGFAAGKKPEEIQRGWLAPRGAAATVKVTQGSNATVTGTLRQKSDFEVTLVDQAGATHVMPIDADTKIEITDELTAHDALIAKLTNADMHNVTAYLETFK